MSILLFKFYFRFSVEYRNVVKFPELLDESLNSVEYALCGFPSTIGSIDCVHVKLWNCPQSFKNSHSGKSGYPTRSYEVICNHRKDIIHFTRGHPGSFNDKCIARFDIFVF